MSLFSTLEASLKKENKLVKDEILFHANVLCKSMENDIKVLEEIFDVQFTVLITPDPLTPIQAQFIQACIDNKQFTSGENK